MKRCVNQIWNQVGDDRRKGVFVKYEVGSAASWEVEMHGVIAVCRARARVALPDLVGVAGALDELVGAQVAVDGLLVEVAAPMGDQALDDLARVLGIKPSLRLLPVALLLTPGDLVPARRVAWTVAWAGRLWRAWETAEAAAAYAWITDRAAVVRQALRPGNSLPS